MNGYEITTDYKHKYENMTTNIRKNTIINMRICVKISKKTQNYVSVYENKKSYKKSKWN